MMLGSDALVLTSQMQLKLNQTQSNWELGFLIGWRWTTLQATPTLKWIDVPEKGLNWLGIFLKPTPRYNLSFSLWSSILPSFDLLKKKIWGKNLPWFEKAKKKRKKICLFYFRDYLCIFYCIFLEMLEIDFFLVVHVDCRLSCIRN